LLRESGIFTSSQFSSDKTLFAASRRKGIRVWKYTSDGYILFAETLLPDLTYIRKGNLYFQFSPTSSLILSWRRNVLQVWNLDDPPITPETCVHHAAISHSGNRIATAHKSESTVAVINLHSQTSPRFIDTGVEIKGLVITGNVLLVVCSEGVVAWLIAGDGQVDGVLDNKRASRSDSLWTVSQLQPASLLGLKVEGQVGAIGNDDISPFIYNIETGAILDCVYEPQRSHRQWVFFYRLFGPRGYSTLRQIFLDSPPENDWLIPDQKTPGAGWVVDSKGRRRFWVPVDWRESWRRDHWHHDIATLFSSLGGRTDNQLVIIKF
jgi:hypothetical protein